TLAGAFFGIPFALVVLQRLAMDQANRVERAGAQRLAVRTGQELWAVAVAATGANNTGSPPSAYQAIDRLSSAVMQMKALTKHAFSLFGAPDSLTGLSTQNERYAFTREEIESMLNAIQEAAGEWNSILEDRSKFRANLGHVRAQWEFFTGTVRARVLEAGFSWIDPVLEENFSRLLNALVASELNSWFPAVLENFGAALADVPSRQADVFNRMSALDAMAGLRNFSPREETSIEVDIFVMIYAALCECDGVVTALREFVDTSQQIRYAVRSF
ncbi:hypothetical protein, partial [Actinoplanes sp. ATCC 53533]|uniref:hypothetical protein n=1 Tax=Actinoplanes sp. ATCC 53533 TaxID=1288362 RepID=UPI001F26FBA5